MPDITGQAAWEAALQPLIEALEPVHGEGLRTVAVYGPGTADGILEPGEAVTVLVVLDDASAPFLRRSSPAVGQLRRRGIEPLFLERHELETGSDVFPLEFLEMKAEYVIVRGEDVLAGLEIPLAGLRLQIEEELRSLHLCLRQEVARYGHRGRPMRTVLCQGFTGLTRIGRGLLTLRGADAPRDVEALIRAAATTYDLDPETLAKLQRLVCGEWQPAAAELDALVDSYDRLLRQLVTICDSMEP